MDERAEFEAQPVLAPQRRRSNLVGVAAAGLVVAAVITTGVLGSRISPSPKADAAPPDASSVAQADVAVPSPSPGPSLSNFHQPTLPRYPSRVLGLQVWTAAYVSKYGLSYFGGSIAVSGWYAPSAVPGCPTPRIDENPALGAEFGVGADAESFCDRSGDLFTAPMFGELAMPIAIELRPGVVAPYDLDWIGVVTPVVFVGELAMVDFPCHTPNSCQAHMVVDHVAWAGGSGQPRTSSILPELLDAWPPLGTEERDQLSVRAIGYQGDVLLDTLVDPATLARIDPHATEIVEAAAPKAERIWYRRVLGFDPEQDPMRWIAIDDTTGQLIASGFEG